MRLHAYGWGKFVNVIYCLLPLLPLAACVDGGDAATLGFSDEGDTQSITVITTMPGASCTLVRGGQVIGTVAATPGTVSVVETEANITVNCTMPGYTGSAVIPADVAGSAAVGMLIGFSPNIYPANVTVTMTPGTSGAPASMPDREQFGGVGIAIIEAAGQPVVLNLLPNGPAARAGLMPGDVITAINGKPTQGGTLADATAASRGAPGTQVAFTIVRGSARTQMQFVLTRETITIAPPTQK